jgi:DHA2 family methylenomycin A resistance protein-like MFS transporter
MGTDLRLAPEARRRTNAALAASVLGFFVVTLDATIVNVVLPSIRTDLGGGVSGMQWVVDGYTLMFAALLLTAGSLTDRLGARNAMAFGIVGFAVASACCGFAPILAVLVAARVAQGCAAALVMPASMALIRHAFPDPIARGRAVGIWGTGAAVASTSGPVLGGALATLDWRWVFWVNLPIAIVALTLLTRVPATERRPAPFDVPGQVLGIAAMGGLTFGAIEAGVRGFTDPAVLAALVIAVAAGLLFVRVEARSRHPMMPLALWRVRAVPASLAIGFAFMVGYFGLPFVASLYLQQLRGLSALATGATFLPSMLTGLILTPFSARVTERYGRRRVLTAGLLLMTAGLAAFASLPLSTPIWVFSAVMVLIGAGGPAVSPPATALLLDQVSARQAGAASGMFNTARQVGGALGIAVFGGLMAHFGTATGMTVSLLIAAAVTVVAALIAARLPDP